MLAASVDEALGALARTPPDLVLLALVMPGRSGFELLVELERVAWCAPAGDGRFWVVLEHVTDSQVHGGVPGLR